MESREGGSPQGAAEARESLWTLQDWSWDPFRLSAKPAGGKVAGSSSSPPPPHTQAEAAMPPASSPSSALPAPDEGMPSSSASGSKAQAAGPADGAGDAPLTAAIEASEGATTGETKKAPVCQVEGCGANLSGLKEYHQRYKICCYHLKINSIVLDGRRVRFCQQCGRFHDMDQFDGDKRSCRQRLQRHNARRRKKGLDDGLSGLAKKQQLLGGHPSALFNGFGRPPYGNPAGGLADLSRVAGLHAIEYQRPRGATDTALDHALGELLQDNVMARAAELAKGVSPSALAAMLADASAASGAGRAPMGGADLLGGGQMSQLDGLRLQEAARDRANAVLAADLLAQQQAQANSAAAQAQQQGAAQAMAHEAAMLGGGGQGDLYSRVRALELARTLSSPPVGGAQQGLLQQAQVAQHQYQQQQQQHAPPVSAPLPPQASLQSLLQQQQQQGGSGAGAGGLPDGALQAMLQQSGLQGEQLAPVLAEAVNLLQSRSFSGYASDEQLMRISTKLFKCTPADLPPELKANLLELLQCSPGKLDAALRQGCVHLTLNARLEADKAAALEAVGVRGAVEHLLCQAGGAGGDGADFWASRPLTVQLHDEIALVRDGRVERVVSFRGSRGVCPRVDEVWPRVVLASAADTITMRGANLVERDSAVLCRHAGSYVSLEVTGQYEEESDGGVWDDVLEVALDGAGGGALPQGLLHLEVLRGGLLSAPQAVLALDDLLAVQQLCELEDDTALVDSDCDALLADIGTVVEALDSAAAAAALAADARATRDAPLREYTQQELEQVAGTAARVVAFAAERGWDTVVRLVLPALLLPRWAPERVVAVLDTACGADMTLLHLCVRAPERAAATVRAVLGWAAAHGVALLAAAPGRGGLTPLHLAAVRNDGELTAALRTLARDGARGWAAARCERGATPADLAAALARAAAAAAAAATKAAALAEPTTASCKREAATAAAAVSVLSPPTPSLHGGCECCASCKPGMLAAAAGPSAKQFAAVAAASGGKARRQSGLPLQPCVLPTVGTAAAALGAGALCVIGSATLSMRQFYDSYMAC